jgi:hypothetical protein
MGFDFQDFITTCCAMLCRAMPCCAVLAGVWLFCAVATDRCTPLRDCEPAAAAPKPLWPAAFGHVGQRLALCRCVLQGCQLVKANQDLQMTGVSEHINKLDKHHPALVMLLKVSSAKSDGHKSASIMLWPRWCCVNDF